MAEPVLRDEMFGKTKFYRGVIFGQGTYEEAFDAFDKTLDASKEIYSTLNFDEDQNCTTHVELPSEDIRRRGYASEYFELNHSRLGQKDLLLLTKRRFDLQVRISHSQGLTKIDEIIAIFDRDYAHCRVPRDEALKKVTVFVGHGRSRLWRDLKDHLQDMHGIRIVAYETGARAGLTIQEVLQKLTSQASIALLVHTAEDVDRDGVQHARENVVHETGLFQGKLGFKRGIVLLEEGCNEFSNIAGLQQIRFAKGNIKEVFGDVLAVLRREFTSDE